MKYITEKDLLSTTGQVLIVESSGFSKQKILTLIHNHWFKNFRDVGFFGDHSNFFHDELDIACIEGNYDICTYLLVGYTKEDLFDLLSQYKSNEIFFLRAAES